jgi:hypothetical protein
LAKQPNHYSTRAGMDCYTSRPAFLLEQGYFTMLHTLESRARRIHGESRRNTSVAGPESLRHPGRR